jgi:hypothetical protein
VGFEFEGVTCAINGRDAPVMIETSVHATLIPSLCRMQAPTRTMVFQTELR